MYVKIDTLATINLYLDVVIYEQYIIIIVIIITIIIIIIHDNNEAIIYFTGDSPATEGLQQYPGPKGRVGGGPKKCGGDDGQE